MPDLSLLSSVVMSEMSSPGSRLYGEREEMFINDNKKMFTNMITSES